MAQPTYSTRALVLRRTKLGESDLILTLLSEDGSQNVFILNVNRYFGVNKKLEADYSRTAEVEKVDFVFPADKIRIKLIETIAEEGEKVDLEGAEIIVSGGRGLGGPEGFETTIKPLADALGGVVGSSRAAVDAGWIPHSHQVGQTGKTVGPKLYVACGISGAIQHLAGMGSSDFIVCINKDPEAPIFGVADLGVIGNLYDVCPALTKLILADKD